MTRRAAASQLRGQYLVQNPLWRTWLQWYDAWLSLTADRRTRPLPNVAPRRILVCIGGHLGDAVLGTAALVRLRESFPEAAIGVVSGSWNRRIFEEHPMVSRFHAVDHWKLSRAPETLVTRWRRYRRTLAQAVTEIRASDYDLALDLYPHYPNFATTLARAKVPTRVGFVSGGGGPLYTHRLQWTPGPITQDHRTVLDVVAPATSAPSVRFELGPIPSEVQSAFDAVMRSNGLRPGYFGVLHIGTGLACRDWPEENWTAVARGLSAQGVGIVLSGVGPAEAARAKRIRAEVPAAIDMVDKLPVPMFRYAARHSAFVLTGDTAAMHIAVAEGAHCVAVLTGIDMPGRWTFALDPADRLTHSVPCAPCFRSRGCETMLCVRGVQPQTVLGALARHVMDTRDQVGEESSSRLR